MQWISINKDGIRKLTARKEQPSRTTTYLNVACHVIFHWSKYFAKFL